MATLVEIVAYDPEWPDYFCVIERELYRLLGGQVASIEHIGSTSIPGMSAKPVIDIDISFYNESDIPSASSILVLAGYQPRGNRYCDGVWAFMRHESNPKQRITFVRRIMRRTGVALFSATTFAIIQRSPKLTRR